jgi:hypothetical protein
MVTSTKRPKGQFIFYSAGRKDKGIGGRNANGAAQKEHRAYI